MKAPSAEAPHVLAVVHRVAIFLLLASGFAALASVGAAGQTPAPAYTSIVTDQTALSLSSKFAVVGNSIVNQNGDYAFMPAGSTALFLRKSGASAPTRLLQHGDAMPGVTGSRFDIFSTTTSITFRMNDSAQLALGVSYLDAAGHLIIDTALYDGSSLQLLVQPSDVAPGSGGKLYGPSVSPVGIDAAGDVAFTALMAPSSDPIQGLNLNTIFIKPAGGAVVRVVGVGDSAPGTGGGTFSSITPISMNNAGVVLFRATISGGVGAVAWYTATTGGIQNIAAVGAATASSTTLTSVGNTGALNNSGTVVFQATDANGVALWTWNSTTGITRLMGHGDAAPADVGGTLNSFQSNLEVSDSGQFASLWTLTGGATSGNVLLRYISAGQMETVAYVGESAPGTATTFSTLQGIAINRTGLIAFKGQVGTGIYTQTQGSSSAALINDGGTFRFGGNYLTSGVTPFVLDDGRIFFNANIVGNSSFDNADLMYNSGTFSTLSTDGDTLPTGASVSLRTFAATSAGNYVGYVAQMSGGQVSYWIHNVSTGTDVRVASTGDAAPGISGGVLRLAPQNQLNMNAVGQVVFLAAVVAAPSNYAAIYLWDPSTGLQLIVKTSDREPTTGLTFFNLQLNPLGPVPINSSGQVLFDGSLSNGSVGLFVYSTAGEVGKLYVSGDTAPGGGTFTSSTFITTAQLNDSGQVAFQASTTNATEAAFIGTPGGAIQMVGPAPSSPTTPLTTDLSFNGNGYAAFISQGELVIASTSSSQVVAATGAAAPASAGGGTFNFTNVSDAYITANNDVLFRSGLTGANGLTGYFYWHSVTGVIDTVFLQGQPVPGLTGWNFDNVLASGNAQSNMGSNTSGEIFLTTSIAPGVSTVEALFRYRPAAQALDLIARRGGNDAGSGGVLTQAIMRNLAGSRAQVQPAFWGIATGGSFGDAIFIVNPVSVNLSGSGTSATIAMGQTADVTFSVTNNGPSAAANTVFTANIPSGMSVSSLPGPNCSSTSTTITCTLGTLQLGETQSGVFGFTSDFSVVPANAASAVVAINGSVSADSSNVPSALAEVTVQRQSDLQIVSVTDNSPVAIAGPLTFTANISNTGPNDAIGVAVSFVLPTSGYTLQSFSSLGTCTQTVGSNVVTCNLGTLAANTNVTGTVTVTPDPAAVTGVSTVVVTSVQISSALVVDPNTSNNTVAINSTIAHTSDLSVTGAGPAGSVTAGAPVTFTATVTNNGPEAANATVTATLPPGFTFVSGSYTNAYASNGSCTFASNVITCPVGSLPYAPASANISIQATAGSRLGFFSMAATASSSTSLDPVPLNNAGSATVLVGLTANAQDALLLPLSTRGTIALFNTSLTQLAAEPPIFTSQARLGPIVLPNGRIAFIPRNGYVSVFDLSIGAEINRINSGSLGYPLVLSPDAKTLVAVHNTDVVTLIDTTSFAATTVPMNGLVGDNPANLFDIGLHAPAIVGRKAYFNASGSVFGNPANGIPLVVLDLDTHAVSTIALPTTSRGDIPASGASLSPYTIVATPDGRYLVIARQDGTVIYDLTTSAVATRETTTTAPRLLATYRDIGNPNAFAYQITSQATPVLSAIDLRTGSPTFGKIVASATGAEPDTYFGNTAIQDAGIVLSGDGSKLFTTDEGGLITTVDVRSLLTNGGGAALNTTTYPNQFDFNGMYGAAVDLTPVAGAPTITSISPSTATAGTTTLVTITGTNFAPDAVVFGNGGTTDPSEIVSVTPTQIQLQLKLDTNESTGTFDVGVTNPNLSSPNQQNLSAVVRKGFTIVPAAGTTVTDTIAAVLDSNEVGRIAPSGPITELPSPPFRSVRNSLAVTTDGAYAITPIGAEGIDVVNLSTGAHSIQAIANTGSAPRLVRSVDPINGASVVYFTDGTTLFKVDANPSSGTFGTSLGSIASGLPNTKSSTSSVAASPDGRYVYVAESNTGLTPDQQVLIYDVQSGTRPANLALSSAGANNSQNSMQVTPDGKYLVLQLANLAQIGLFSLANPTSPVSASVLTGTIPPGYVALNLSNYLVAKDHLFAIGTLTDGIGLLHTVIDVFQYDPAANNFSLLQTYFDDQLSAGPMQVSSDGTRLYVDNVSLNRVDVLDISKLLVAAPQPVVAKLNALFGPGTIAVAYDQPAAAYGLSLTMTHTPEPAARTGMVTFILTVTNTGNSDLTNVTISNPLPAGTAFVPTNPACLSSAGTIGCTLRTVSAGQTEQVPITLVMPSTIQGVTDDASVFATEAPSGATASDTVNVGNGADITVVPLASPGTTTPGGTVVFTTTVTNNGPDASGATVTETLPSGFTFVSATYTNPAAGNGTCGVSGQVVTCNVGSLPYSGSATTATITLTANAGTQLGLFSLKVNAASQNNEVNPLDNSKAAAVVVAASPNAQDAFIIDENASASLRFMHPGSLTEFASLPFVMAQPRLRPVVLPNARLLFTGSSYISVIDLSIQAEIRRIPIVASGPYALTADGKTLVVPSRDSVVLVDTATFQTTTIDLNGLIGDDPSKTNDIDLGAAIVANNKAYFNPTGLLKNSTTVGLPVVVVDLASHAVSTLAFPTLSLAPNNNFEDPTAAATPDGNYLVALRRDGIVIFDLTTNSVVMRNATAAISGSWTLTVPRTSSDPRVFAYLASNRGIYQLDMRAGSPTFGQIIGIITTTTNTDINGASRPEPFHPSLTAQGAYLFTDDFYKTVTSTTTDEIQTAQAIASTNFILSGIDLNSSGTAIVDFTPLATAPTVTSVSPSAITTDGGTITVQGTGFASGAMVRIGQNAPLPATFISPTQLQVTIPAGAPAQSAMDVVVTIPNTSADISQQNLSGILRAAFSVELPSTVRLASPLVSPMFSNGVTFINRRSQFNAIAQSPLHEVQGAGAITADGGYLITPVSGDQINATTPVDGGIAITNLSTGATTIQTSPIVATAAGTVSLVPSVNPNGGGPVMYLAASKDTYNDMVVEMIDANPASGTFGQVLTSVNAGIPSGQFPAPAGLAATSDGRYVFAGNEDLNTGTSTYRVYVLDMLNRTVVGNFNPTSVGAAQTQARMTFAGGNLLMVMSNTKDIGAFDVTTTPGTAVLGNTLSGILPSGAVSLSVNNFTFANNVVYVSAIATNSNGTTSLALQAFHFDTANNNYAAIVNYTASPVTASGPLAISSDGTQVYLTATSADQVQIFDQSKLVTNAAGALVASFGTPFGPAQFVANNAATVPSTDLRLAMTATPDPVAVGGTLTFNYTISNNGPLAATNAILTDTLPAGTSIVGTPSITCSGATCSCNNASPLVCSVSNIPVSGTVTGTFSITAPPAAGSYFNNASVVADQAATTTSNTVSVTGTAVLGADVSVTISQPTNPVVTNTPVAYAVVVHNAGQGDATGVSLQLDGGPNFTNPSSVVTAQGTCAPDASSCSLGTITAGSSAAVTVTTTSQYPGSFSVVARATANEADPNLANNTAYQTTMFLPSANGASRYIVPDRASGRLRQYAIGTNAEVPAANEPTAGYNVLAMAVMPNGRIGFTAQFSNYVSVVDFSLGKEIALIPIRARTLALTPDGTKLLIVNALADELDVVDTSTLNVIGQISYNGLSGLGDDPNSADVNAVGIVVVGSKVFLNPAGAQFNLTTGLPIIAIDLTANSASVVPGSAVGRGFALPNSIAATPDGQLLIALRGSGNQSLVIDPNTNAVLFTFTNFAPGSGAMAITADKNDPRGYFAYISTGTQTNVLDLRQGSATFGRFLIAGAGVSGSTTNSGTTTALSADGSRLYVAPGPLSTTAPQVDVYDTAALLTNPSTAFLGGQHISDFVARVFTAITDTSAPAGAPSISTVAPPTVAYEQATQITITGSNFSSDARVRIGKGGLIVPDSVSSTQLLVTVPAQTPAGTLDVTVVNLNSASAQAQQLAPAVANGALTVSAPVAFAPKYQVFGHDSGDGSVFQLVRTTARTFVNQIALVPGAPSPDGSTLWVPITAGLLPYNFDTHSGTVITGIPNAENVAGIATGIDPVTSHSVVYLSTHATGATGDAMLQIVDAEAGSPTFGQVLRTINANLNDGSFAFSAAVTPDGRYVYTATSATTNRLVIYDTLNNTATAVLRSTLGLGTSSVPDLRISPDGQRLITTDTTGAIAVLDVGTNPLSPARVGTLVPIIPSGLTSITLNNYVITGNNFVFALDGTQNVAEVFNFNCGTSSCVASGTYTIPGMPGDYPSGALTAPPDGSVIYAAGFRSNVVTVLDPNLIVAGNPNPVVARLAAGVAPSGPAVSSRTIADNDLSISLVAPASVSANGNYTYQLTIHNGGAATATGVTVLQQLPGTFVSADATCSGTSNISCSLGPIAPGADAGFTVTTLAPPTSNGPLHTIATVTANENDSNLANNTATGDSTLAVACAPNGSYDKAWTGGISSNWSDPSNWSPAGVPTATNNVFVCAGATYAPALTAAASTQDLLLEAGATITTNGFNLTAAGNVNAADSITGTGTLVMSGSGVTLQGTVPNLTVTGTASLAGPTTATGVVTVTPGQLTINGQTLNTVGLTIGNASAQGLLVMANASDVVNVSGNLSIETQRETGLITAGTLSVGGNLTTCCSGWDAYPATGTNTVVLNGTASQTITMNPNATQQTFRDLVINNSAGVSLASNIIVNGTLTLQAGTLSAATRTITATNVVAASGTTLNIGTLATSGTISAAAATYNVANTTFTGTGPQSIPVLPYQAINVTGTAQLTGTTTATGAVTVTPGQLAVNGQTLNAGSLTIGNPSAQGLFVMTNAADAVNVAGNVSIETQREAGLITAGTLRIGGNLTTCCSGWDAYPATGTNTVVLNGTGSQTITMNANATQQAFHDLVINNSGGQVNLASNIVVNGTLTLQAGTLSGASQTITATNLTAGAGTTLNVATLSFSGALSAPSANYNVANTIFTGSGAIPGLQYQTLTVTGAAQLSAPTTVAGAVSVTGSLTINGQTLNAGSLTIGNPSAQGQLVMTNPADAINVSGNVSIETQRETGSITAGTLRVGGNLTTCCSGWDAYPATGTNTVVLNGTGTQTVNMASPAAGLQTFHDLVISNTTGTISLATNVAVNGTLTSTSAGANISGAGQTLTTAGVNVTQLVFNGALLSIGAGPLTQFNSVVFQNMPAGAVQLTVLNPGSSLPLVFDNIKFLTAPVSPGLYVSATDTNPTDGLPLVIDFEHNQPSDGSAFTAALNGAVVNWFGDIAELSIAGTASGGGVLGGDVTYTYAITNNGPDNAGTTTFTDAVPANMSFISADIGGVPCTAPNNIVTCTAASLAPGGVVTVHVVLHPTATGGFTNVASVAGTSHDSNTADNSISITSTITASTDLSLTATPSVQQTQPGGTLTYTIVLSNGGPSDATGVVVTDTLPIGVTLQSATTTAGACSGSTTVTCAIGTLTNGANATITIAVQATGAGPLLNSVNATANEADPVPANNSATVTVPSYAADLVLSVNAPSGILFGADQPYTFTIANNGPYDAGATSFTDTIPANMTLVSADINGTPCAAASGTITCSLASLAANASVNVNVVLHPAASGTFSSTANVRGTLLDTNTANNTLTANVTISPDADLRIVGSVNPQQVQPGANVTYTITAQNFGPSDATGVVITNTLPGLEGVVSATATVGTCSGTAPVTCAVGTLTNGSSVTVTIVAQVNGAGALAYAASVSANETDTAPLNNSLAINSSSIAADLAITTAPAGTLNGSPAYSATLTNNGPSVATGVVFTANLVRYTLVSVLPSTCTYAAPVLTCQVGSMASGTSATITIAAQAPDSGWAELDVAAHANEFDPNPTNNAVRITPPSDQFNTPAGSAVTVDTSDGGGSAEVTFGSVTLPGLTSLTTLPFASAAPAGFRTGATSVYFDVKTTAQFTGAIGVTFRFAPNSFHHPSRVRLFHMENGIWVDRTTGINVATGTASAVTASLSPFALFEPLDTAPVANAGGDAAVNGSTTAGAQVSLDASASSDADGDALTYRWSGPFPEGGGTVTGIRPTVTLPFGASRLTLVVNDGELDSAPSAVNVNVSDFIVAPSAPNASVTAGTSATYTIAVSPKFGAFNAPVTLSCGNLPAGMTCSFSPATITPGANGASSMLTISTAKVSATNSLPAGHRQSPWLALTLAPFGFVLLGGVERRRMRYLGLGLMLVMLLAAVGCGGGGGTNMPSQVTSATRQPTTSTITITATSAGLAHSTSVSITVQ